MVFLLSLGSTALYGAADFLGGIASRRASTIAVVFLSQLAGMVLLVAILPLLPEGAPSTRDLAWGSVAGLAGGAGVALLYRALAVGRMAVVAPTTAVCAVAIPVLAAIIMGERPSPPTLAGMAVAVVAIVLVSRPGGEDELTRVRPTEGSSRFGALGGGSRQMPAGLGLALLSGVAIGLFYLALARTAPAAGLWPLVAARFVSVAFFGLAAAVGRRSLRMTGRVAATVIGAGTIDMLANAAYLVATRSGPLSVVVTLSSLYPASTVILARLVLGERLSTWQGAGIVCALAAVALIVGGG